MDHRSSGARKVKGSNRRCLDVSSGGSLEGFIPRIMYNTVM
jgi:hypothetical protein